jgi:hypothetical protein
MRNRSPIQALPGPPLLTIAGSQANCSMLFCCAEVLRPPAAVDLPPGISEAICLRMNAGDIHLFSLLRLERWVCETFFLDTHVKSK